MEEIEYFDKAKDYLMSLDGVTGKMIDAHLNDWKNKKPKDISGLFKKCLFHAQNRRNMKNTIGNIDNLESILCNFDPQKVAHTYSSWDSLFSTIENGTYKPPGRLQKSKLQSFWVIYCKSIVSIANFLLLYKNIEEFDTFVKGFLTNEHSRSALPLLIKEELFGFGFALACDFLKENGYPDFVKPDTHLNEIARGLGISEAQSDFGIFKDVQAYCKRIKKRPYEVDKLFWLVGSGNFYLNHIEVKSSKQAFIESINSNAVI